MWYNYVKEQCEAVKKAISYFVLTYKMIDDFGKALSAFMVEHHLTQQEVANRTGIAQPVIGRLLKTAQPEMPTIRKIAEGLCVHIDIVDGGRIVINPLGKSVRFSPDWLDHYARMSERTGLTPTQCAEKVATINQQHIRAVVLHFLTECNKANATKFAISDQRDPSAAVVIDGDKTFWVEVADVFLDEELEKTLYDLASGNEGIQQNSGVKVNPDEKFATKTLTTIDTKLADKNYHSLYEAYGQGVLVVSLHNPLFNDRSLEQLKRDTQNWIWRRDTNYFGQVWLYEDSKFNQWSKSESGPDKA